MNILFITWFDISPQKGGTERITWTISNALRKYYNYKCFCAYIMPATGFEQAFCDGRIKLDEKKVVSQLHDYIVDNQINVIVNQGIFSIVEASKKAVENTRCKILFAYHFAPLTEKCLSGLKPLVEMLGNNSVLKRIKASVKIAFYPIYIRSYSNRFSTFYKKAYDMSDAVVLLSERFKKDFVDYAGIQDDSRLRFIPNSLSYSRFADLAQIMHKEKRVLIVSRFDEPQKRISYALKIWRIVKQYPEAGEWKLDIVGHGAYAQLYRRMAYRLGLDDVRFLGAKKPEEDYIRASIFMMTSRTEGWGLTLTESQQFGVVPVAFDSYASLYDIIIDGYNGVIVPDNKLEVYAEAVVKLMKNDRERQKLAMQAVESSHRYEEAKIVEMWNRLLEELTKKL